MKATYTLRQRAFLNSVSTGKTSHVYAQVESVHDGRYPWGDNLVMIADCRRSVTLEFFLGSKRHRRLSIAKINLLIDVLTRFRDALMNEIALIEKEK
jgi:hypothetical protein